MDTENKKDNQNRSDNQNFKKKIASKHSKNVYLMQKKLIYSFCESEKKACSKYNSSLLIVCFDFS
jgi:hypothetical protein